MYKVSHNMSPLTKVTILKFAEEKGRSTVRMYGVKLKVVVLITVSNKRLAYWLPASDHVLHEITCIKHARERKTETEGRSRE